MQHFGATLVQHCCLIWRNSLATRWPYGPNTVAIWTQRVSGTVAPTWTCYGWIVDSFAREWPQSSSSLAPAFEHTPALLFFQPQLHVFFHFHSSIFCFKGHMTTLWQPLHCMGTTVFSVVPTQSARNLGVVFDNTMNFEKHISEICKSAFFHIRNISQVRRYLSIESTKTLIHAFVTSRIDNCNAVLYGLPSYLVQRLQYVLNSAARLIFLSRKAGHITPPLIDLHWLPVEQRINFKIMLLTYKIINGLAPSYLSNLLVPYVPRRALRSADKLLLSQPSYRLKSYGFKAFSICAPRLWNKLPINIKCSQSVGTFKCNLKTYLFRLAYY